MPIIPLNLVATLIITTAPMVIDITQLQYLFIELSLYENVIYITTITCMIYDENSDAQVQW